MSERDEQFNQHRLLLFSIAYHMLGSAMDAEDLVQEAFLRWQQARAEEVQSPKAYLSTIITRLCMDHWRSARVQREQYIGPWLPEPLMTGSHAPTPTTELADSLSLAFLVVLESLSPVERAVFLLREVFDYDYAEIARIVGKRESNCRQIAARAKQQIATRRPRFRASREQHEQLLSQFVQSCASGDMDGLLHLLAEDIILYSDGGGKAGAALRPIRGPDHVARYIFGVLKKAPATYSVQLAEVNAQPALLGYLDGRLYHVLALDVAEGRVRGIYLVLNPDKLRAWQH